MPGVTAPPPAAPEWPDAAAPLRRILLGIVFVGALGLELELLLLEHFESPWQWAPLVLLGAVLAGGAALAARPARGTVRLFQGLMLLCLAFGLIGVYLHYVGNVEFQLEEEPTRRGLALFWEAIRGATPALAPGALVQLGLVGLASTFRQPMLRASPPVRATGAGIHSGDRS